MDEDTRKTIESKSNSHGDAKERSKGKVEKYAEEMITKLNEIKSELMNEVESAFENDPFAEFLARVADGTEDNFRKEEIEQILSIEIPNPLGPNEEALQYLLELIGSFKAILKERKENPNALDLTPKNFRCSNVTRNSITLTWSKVSCECYYEAEVQTGGVKNIFRTFKPEYTLDNLEPSTEYTIRIRTVAIQSIFKSGRSDLITVKTKDKFFGSKWKECPNNEYLLDTNNPKIATKIGDNDRYCTIIGNTPLPINKVTSWSVKILKSKENDGGGILIGVAPSDINQNEDNNHEKCGWYFGCYCSGVFSGPPVNYKGNSYGPRKEAGKYVQTGDNVGVVMDTTKGELSFVVNGVNLGVAYEGIPLDKPLVPCVILCKKGDSVELDTSEVKEKVDNYINISNIKTKSTTWDSITLTWDAVEGASFYQIEVDENKFWDLLTNTFTKRGFLQDTEYTFRVRAVKGNSVSEWSDVVKVKTLKESFETSRWKGCPYDAKNEIKYYVNEENLIIATKISDRGYCTIIGNTPLPPDKVTSWSIKILKSKENDGHYIFIGVVPFDINQNEEKNWIKCGWYFHCWNSTLCSGPPHNHLGKEYGPRKKNGKYVHTGDSVGVVMDTAKGELSFVLNRVDLGVAYEGIPLDKPLVPCVLLWKQGDSVELDTSEVKENIDSSIPVPSNITTESITWDSITLTWDAVEGASFYQIEVDGIKSWYQIEENTLGLSGSRPDTEHTFRVRAVGGNSVSEWSGVVKGRTQKESFETSGWKECPGYVDEKRKYYVPWKYPKFITKINNSDLCTIIGNTPLPLNKVTSWSIKVLKSKGNDCDGICIGVAPSDINQNEGVNYKKCGWYFHCFLSTLCSGPPHNHLGKEYGPRKGKGEYVHTGDSVGIVMNTTKGELSFVVNGVNLGVAYEGVPLDKPLVPCVLLYYEGDFIELDTSEVKENVNSSILVPSNITAKSTTWDTITLTWNAVEGASFYQVEVDGNKNWYAFTTNIFTTRGLPPETDYTFRVRTVRWNSVSEWSGVVKGRTQKKSFESGWWKKCPNGVDEERKYSIVWANPRLATNIGLDYCTIIGNLPLPLNKVTSWSIKILKSEGNDGSGIYVGVAPFDINQNNNNKNKCGWYFDCWNSILWSGPPHNYSGEEYGPRKEAGQYVHTGDSVGVAIGTTNGELSFVVNGVNHGVAYEGIPLDKPLVPCVILRWKGESIELDTSEVKENVSSSIPVPSNITTKSIMWDRITFTWDAVEGASSYQIVFGGIKPWYQAEKNTLTLIGFRPETELIFSVRTVRGNSVSKWSNVMRGRTQNKSFENGWWRECPKRVEDNKKYSIDSENPRIATNLNDNYCTIIGNTPIPLNKVTSWSIKILKSKNNNGDYIYVGVAPSYINQNDGGNNFKCGWYFDCGSPSLYSGPPHNYYRGSYEPKKDLKKYSERYAKKGQVGVIMDTTKGDLSFVLDKVNYGIAYKGIPLDKPLVPCVILGYKNDSVEFMT